METDAPDALPKSELGSLFLIDGDPSIPEELQGQGGKLSTSSDLTRDEKDASALPKGTFNHPANIQNVRAFFAFTPIFSYKCISLFFISVLVPSLTD